MATYRPQNHGRSKSGKPQKPGLMKRHSGYSVPKSKSVSIRDDREEVDEDMTASSFLQFCATCEKQIVNPSSSILYCSERCRKHDRARVVSYDDFATNSPPMTPLELQAPSSYEKFQDIVPQRSPTAVQIPRNRYSYSSFSEDESACSDDEKYSDSRRTSEAERYLRQFVELQTIEYQSRTPRPQYHRSSTNFSTLSGAPSLSHSPTSTTADMSYPYTPASRPLPPRTNPTYSTSFKYSKSSDLVNPFPMMSQIVPSTAPSSLQKRSNNFKSGAGAATSQGTAAGDVLYMKSSISRRTSGPSESLKNMMRAGPYQFERQ